MKIKIKKPTSLTLNVDRLRTLEPAEAREVAGGMQLVTTIIQNF